MTEERDASADDEAGAPGPPAPGDGGADAAAPGDGGADATAADGPAGAPGGRDGLGARERALLAVERRSWPGPGAKERAVRERLGLSPTRYYQLLNALLDDPRALAHDPVTVNRLRGIRAERRQRR